MKRLGLTLTLLLALSAGLWANQYGVVSGIVSDESDGRPLFGANVTIEGTLLGAAADSRGHFSVNVPPGRYTLAVSMMGYKRQETSVDVAPGDTSRVTFQLSSTVLQQPAVVVTASKRPQRIDDAPVSVEVLTRRDIAGRSAATLDQVIQNTPGVAIIDNQIDFRGSTGFNWAAGSRVLFMMDGHPLINGDTGGISWDAVPVEEVERIEMVKGAGSALYGSNAMAGMINVIMRKPTSTPHTRWKASWGFYTEPAHNNWTWSDDFLFRQIEAGKLNLTRALGFEGIDISHSRQVGRVGLLMTLGRKTARGYFQNGDYSRWNGLVKMHTRLSPALDLSLLANYALDDHGDFLQWSSQSTPLQVPLSELGNRVWNEKANAHATLKIGIHPSLACQVKLNGYRNYWQNEFRDNRDYATNYRWGAEVQFTSIRASHALTWGAEGTWHSTRSLIYGDHATQDYAVYAEDEVEILSDLTFTLGGRFDYHRVKVDENTTLTDSHFSPRTSLVWHPWTGGTFRASAGHGFRAPSIAEVFASIKVSGFNVIANPGLDEAEKAWSYELGWRQMADLSEWGDGWWRVLNPVFIFDAALFYSQYRNMIDVQLNSREMAFQFVNLGRARNRGCELRLTASLMNGRFNGYGGLTWMDPEDLDTGAMLPYRSKVRFNTGLEFHVWKFIVGGDYRYSSRMEEVVNIYSADQRVPMHVLDARLAIQLKNVQIAIEGRNLRNYHYTLRQRMLEPVRHFVFTLRGSI